MAVLPWHIAVPRHHILVPPCHVMDDGSPGNGSVIWRAASDLCTEQTTAAGLVGKPPCPSASDPSLAPG